MLRVDHAALCVVLVNHVFLRQLQVQILCPCIFVVEDDWVDAHALFVLAGFSFVFFFALLLQLLELFFVGTGPAVPIDHLHIPD